MHKKTPINRRFYFLYSKITKYNGTQVAEELIFMLSQKIIINLEV